jgi:hypothetical protein
MSYKAGVVNPELLTRMLVERGGSAAGEFFGGMSCEFQVANMVEIFFTKTSGFLDGFPC